MIFKAPYLSPSPHYEGKIICSSGSTLAFDLKTSKVQLSTLKTPEKQVSSVFINAT